MLTRGLLAHELNHCYRGRSHQFAFYLTNCMVRSLFCVLSFVRQRRPRQRSSRTSNGCTSRTHHVPSRIDRHSLTCDVLSLSSTIYPTILRRVLPVHSSSFSLSLVSSLFWAEKKKSASPFVYITAME